MRFEMTQAEREARIVRCLEDMAPNFYPWPGDAARYVIETCFKDATPAEWDFAARYVSEHPEVKDGPTRHIADVLAGYRDEANAKWKAAGKAAMSGQFNDALTLLREAFLLNPDEAGFWARYAGIVEDKRAEQAGARS